MSARLLAEKDAVECRQNQSRVTKGISIGLDEVIFLRLPEVKVVTGLSKSSLYALIRANSFPEPVRLGPRTVGWVKSEVRQWAVERVMRSRSATPHRDTRLMPQSALRETWTSPKKWA